MKLSFHNRLAVKIKNKSYIFYNSLLPSTLERLSTFQNYNSFISIGNGLPDNSIQNQCKLSKFLKTIPLSNKTFQSDISKGVLFARYEFYLANNNTSLEYLTELGLSNDEQNPSIYNYFSLISDETPNGISISNKDEVLFEITINLTIEEQSILLTSGQNPFIEYLLGNGLGDVYICNSSNQSENIRITREFNPNLNLSLCSKSANLENNSLEISFEQNLTNGELDEILFVANNKVFARKNIKEINPTQNETSGYYAKENYIIKINEDIKSITSITNQDNNTPESNYFVSNYANSFGDKINLPFDNLFDSTSCRFLSKCGSLIFFVLSDKVYGYKNQSFNIIKLDTSNIDDNDISKIISFDNYVFIISKIFPYISTYIISNNRLIKTENNFSNLSNIEDIKNAFQLDITHCKNNKFILGIIKENKTALTIYFDYSEDIGFSVSNQIENNKEFNYLVGMYHNNFCDGQIIYLKEGNSSAECRLVTHSADMVETDIYSSLAYHLMKDSKNIYSKSRAIISEKTTEPSIVIYYYPQIFEYKLPLISEEIKDFISADLNYIIQHYKNNEFKIYNLVGYDTPEEFINTIDILESPNHILDFEFMKDTLLIFTNNKTEKIIAYNLKLNKTQIENLSKNNTNYLVNLTKYNKLGKNNETINFKFISRITIWYFQTKF